jgi:hypothetical protein
MKLIIYFKNYFLNDIILFLVVSGLVFLAIDIWDENEVINETTVELVPLNVHPDDELG